MHTNDPFNTAFFRTNRARLQKIIGTDEVVIVAANGLLQRSADTTYPFSQDRNFWYLTGLNEPNLLLGMHGSESFLVLPKSDAVRDIFDGKIDEKHLLKCSGVSHVYTYADGWEKIAGLLRARKTCYTLFSGSLFQPRFGLYLNPARRRLLQALRRKIPNITLEDVRPALAQLRMIKQQPELVAIQKAVDITVASLEAVRQSHTLHNVAAEYELEALITREFRFRGAAGHAYTPIVANGAHATTLHYTQNSGMLDPRALTVVDVGAEWQNYAADITRTFSIKKPTTRQQAVYDAVREVQNYALSLLKPGALLKDYETQVAYKMGEVLVSLRLASNANDMHVIRTYFPHATSHFLGLDVHDVGEYNLPLQPGVVLTCEPGLYIPEEGIGVRIEDDVAITETGYKNLSAHCSYNPLTV